MKCDFREVPEEEVVGLPMLIVFSDGALLAYGAAAYIRWELASGGYWVQLIMAKCKIAPKHILSVPKMELNGADLLRTLYLRTLI